MSENTLLLAVDAVILGVTLYHFSCAYFTVKLPEIEADRAKKRKPKRVYVDGCFDMMHFGHANALRQAKALGDILVVGICSDKAIEDNKGPPVMKQDERYKAVQAVKWVDEIIPGIPYDVTEKWLDSLLNEHHIDIIVHGDDPCLLPDGRDAYEKVRKAGMFRNVKRTEGVSSTDIVGRMLLCTKDHFTEDPRTPRGKAMPDAPEELDRRRSSSLHKKHDDEPEQPFRRVTQFLPTTRRLRQFSEGKSPKAGDKIVYIDGSWDMFHVGHVEILEKAQSLGDFLIVGIHDDWVVNEHRGRNFPIMNLHERTLSVLSCRYVDEVIIGAPWEITKDMCVSMNITVCVHGTVSDPTFTSEPTTSSAYEVPRQMGIFQEISSERALTASEIVDRILQNKTKFEARQKKKEAGDKRYQENKAFVEEI